MDGSRFDALTLRVATSRRGALKVLLGAAVGGVLSRIGGSRAAAASCRSAGRICREHANCCSGLCGPRDAAGRSRCHCKTAADCPTPTNKCQTAACVAGVCDAVDVVSCAATDQCHDVGFCIPTTGQCSNPARPNGATCDDGDACTENDTCQDGTCRPGASKTCPPCQTCRTGDCRAVVSDARCDGSCINGICVPACLPVRSVCDVTANTCCQDVGPAQCSPEANCTTTQEARCCRPFGAACSDRCDCCSNADCIDGICGLPAGQQCVDRTECGEFGSECCDGICRTLANDPANCGACGRVCPPPPPGGITRCDTFTCTVECTGGRTLCNGVCRDLDGDEANCGACGHACAAGETCCFGVCRDLRSDERNCGLCNITCQLGRTCCDGQCVDLSSDANYCGRCDNNCIEGPEGRPDGVCCSGQCTTLRNDDDNCGRCGLKCPSGTDCVNGLCLD